jgi:polysaccharide deacetylase family protein (PEP-CTERM system associated)
MYNALSVDVEDWFQVGAFEKTIKAADWDSLEQRVERNTRAVMALYARCNVKATFFTLGWVAERYPDLIREIVSQGHELASHGWDHKRVFTMTPESFRADIRRTKTVLEAISGQPIKGYRAPSFSIDKRTPWAHAILADEGHSYSSSVAPVVHDHYGWPEAPRFAFKPLADNPFVELPVATVQVAGRNFAAGGGGFFRLLPGALSYWAIRRLNNQEKQPAPFYFHPWEIDTGQPYRADAPLRSRLRHYSRIASMEARLEKLFQAFQWSRYDDVISRMSQ